ncbi:hypothetical protein BH10CYA1_BH10CYA1_64560 [soil metagenome]
MNYRYSAEQVVLLLQSMASLTAACHPATVDDCLSRATEFYDRGNYSEAVAYASQALFRKPNDHLGRALRGCANLQLGKPQLALSDFSVIKQDARDVVMVHLWCAQAHIMLADTISALEDLNVALELDRFCHFAFYLRGKIYVDLKNYEQAFIEFTDAIEIMPTYTYFIARSVIPYVHGAFEATLADLGAAIDSEPELPHGFIARGTLLLELGMWQACVEDFSAALQRSPDIGLVFYLRSLAWLRLGNFSSAVSDMTEAANRVSSYQDVLNELIEKVRVINFFFENLGTVFN